MGVDQLVIWLVAGILGFIGWLIKRTFASIEEQENRITVLETKLDVMGDINNALYELKTDVAVIKQKLDK